MKFAEYEKDMKSDISDPRFQTCLSGGESKISDLLYTITGSVFSLCCFLVVRVTAGVRLHMNGPNNIMHIITD